MLTSSERLYLTASHELTHQFQVAGIEILNTTVPFEPNTVHRTNFDHSVRSILRIVRLSGFRIVYVLAYEQDTHTFAKQSVVDRMAAGYA